MARILAIHAHPDDVEILAGGTLALLAARGHEITIATFTPGDCGSRDLGPEEIAAIRRREAANAAARIGAEYFCLEMRDLRIFNDDPSRRRVTEALRQARPEVVLTASPVDYMCDHEIASALVRDACFERRCRTTPPPAPPSTPFRTSTSWTRSEGATAMSRRAARFRRRRRGHVRLRTRDARRARQPARVASRASRRRRISDWRWSAGRANAAPSPESLTARAFASTAATPTRDAAAPGPAQRSPRHRPSLILAVSSDHVPNLDAICPPSTNSVAPVIYDAASEARNTHGCATSSGDPPRASGSGPRLPAHAAPPGTAQRSRHRPSLNSAVSSDHVPNFDAICPPSTDSVAPVMYDAASEARNTHACATSSGDPPRPSGIWRK